jgi:hypothetical protein
MLLSLFLISENLAETAGLQGRLSSSLVMPFPRENHALVWKGSRDGYLAFINLLKRIKCKVHADRISLLLDLKIAKSPGLI